MSRMPIRVVKVGGSLLDLPDLGDRLRGWLRRQSAAHHVLLAGGGKLVDEVRRWHEIRPLADVAAHWMCIDLLTVTAHLLHERLPEIPLVEDDLLLCQRIGDQACTIFGPAPWMRHSESRIAGKRLPASWGVTSDAIAGRLATVMAAEELVLAKSCLPAARDLAGAASEGLLDSALARYGCDLPSIRIVNVRSNLPDEMVLSSVA